MLTEDGNVKRTHKQTQGISTENIYLWPARWQEQDERNIREQRSTTWWKRAIQLKRRRKRGNEYESREVQHDGRKQYNLREEEKEERSIREQRRTTWW